MPAAVIVDAVLVTTVLGSLMVLGALVAARAADRWSGHLRHQLVWFALLTNIGIFAGTILLQPGPTGCLTRACGGDAVRASRAGQAQEYYTVTAAGKFGDLAPIAAAGEPSRPAGSRLVSLFVPLWLTGAALTMVGVARRRWRAFRIVRDAEPVLDPDLAGRLALLAGRCGVRRRVRLRRHPRVLVPAVTGTMRPTLLVPAGFERESAASVHMVLVHELTHLSRRDGMATLLGELAVVICWFNPIIRRAARAMRDLQEVAADSQVLASGVKPSAYAQFLLHSFRAATRAAIGPVESAHAILGDCQMETRLHTILDPRAVRGVPSRARTVVLGAASAMLGALLMLAPTALEAHGRQQTRARPGAPPATALLNARALDSILRPVFISHMADRYIAGAAVTVVHEGAVVYRGGFGRREVYHEVPVHPDRTIWRIGSITKVLTGVAIMQLVDRGLLDLDADVNQYLTDIQVPPTFEEPVRVRHLLTHTAGFDQIGIGRHARTPEEVRPLAAFLRDNLVRIRPPGQVTTYDTYGITLAGYLVEVVSGLPYEEYLRRHLFGPLRMHRSGITVPPALRDDVAVGYGFAGTWEAAGWEYMNTDPASTVNATAPDMANLAAMLLEGGRFEGRQILSEASARAMLTRQFTNHPDHPGYSFTLFEDMSYGVPAFSHGGSMEGFGAMLYLVPEHRLGVFIAANQESGSLAHAVVERLVEAVFPGRIAEPAPRPRLPRPVDLSRFVGTYANSMYHHGDPTSGWRIRPFALTADAEGRLVFDGAPAHAVGPLSFQRDDGVLLTFREDSGGAITHFFVNQTVYERLD